MFAEAWKKLYQEIEEALAELQELKDNDLYGHLAVYKKIYEADSELERAAKLLKGIKSKLSYETIPKIMDDLKTDSIRYDGRNFIRSVRLDASIPEEMREKGYAWLKEQGLGSIIKESAHAKTLSSVLDDFIQETGVMPPEDCVKLHRQPYIQIRK